MPATIVARSETAVTIQPEVPLGTYVLEIEAAILRLVDEVGRSRVRRRCGACGA